MIIIDDLMKLTLNCQRDISSWETLFLVATLPPNSAKQRYHLTATPLPRWTRFETTREDQLPKRPVKTYVTIGGSDRQESS